MKFSVLMSIYIKENPAYFKRAMESIWDEQTLKPDEIILVQDGPLTPELYEAIENCKNKISVLKTIPLEKNMGLGNALNIGIKHCTNEVIARMDTDDISHSDRFEKQLEVFNNGDIDVCSAFISEFENDEDNIIFYRKVPQTHEEIIKYAKFRSPLNHAVTMYKKSAVEKAGGYKDMPWMEDYYLWARMIINGAKFYNIQEVLLNVRGGMEMVERRSGLNYAKSELRMLKQFKKIGFLNLKEYYVNVILRFSVRLMPKTIIKLIYSIIRTSEIKG